MPEPRWVLKMTWDRLLFAHWPMDPALLAPRLPQGLELETFDGAAWIGVVPFGMSGVRFRALPPLPTAHRFLELNVRTYVTDGEQRGVWFFSLDAQSRLAVWGARRTFGLNYCPARMGRVQRNGAVEYDSMRRCEPAADFRAVYRPRGDLFRSTPGSLEEFLTERYWLFAGGGRRGLRRAQVWHERWPLRRAEARLELNTMAHPLGVDLPGVTPHLLYSEKLDVLCGAPERAGR